MPVYKLIYFSKKGIAQVLRLMFNYAGVDYVDNIIDIKDWQRIGPTTPFGKLPVLEVDGKNIQHRIAICRYIAKQTDLYGKDNWEALEIDATVDTIYDVYMKISIPRMVQHPEGKAEAISKTKEVAIFLIKRLDEQVKKNGGYFVNGKITHADFFFVGMFDNMLYPDGDDLVEKTENLKTLKEKILSLSSIKSMA